jgi:hypothetical protein
MQLQTCTVLLLVLLCCLQDYLASAYPDSGTPLIPPDPYAAARVKLFTQYFTVRGQPASQEAVWLAAAAAVSAAVPPRLHALRWVLVD